ncbi:MAG: biotin--[acetyl-CoA-carboxylase] ligase [Bacteroidetes bacterium]|nr:biotin--[acetyl-CoA-carboxylase] ligase [Bacteroidota bacterium]
MKGVFGSQTLHLSEVDSTNNYAAKLVSDGLCQNGAVILADFQTKGKGQRGNHWLSKKGKNILMSVVYHPDDLSVCEQIKFNWGVSLAIISFLEDFGIDAQVKWPNDIFVQNNKIAGILIENQLTGYLVSSSIFGIGLNVNQIDHNLKGVTSMRKEKNETFCLKSIIPRLVDKLNYFIFCEFHWLKEQYESKLYRKDKDAPFEDADGLFVGKILGVNKDGSLKLSRGNKIKEYGMKEITFRIDL